MELRGGPSSTLPTRLAQGPRNFPRMGKIWREALHLTFGLRIICNTLELHNPLGEGHQIESDEWNLRSHENRLYLKQSHGWKVYRKVSRTRLSQRYVYTECTSDIPPDSKFATGVIQQNTIIGTGSFDKLDRPHRAPTDVLNQDVNYLHQRNGQLDN